MSRYASTSPEELVSACTDPGNAAAWEEFVHRFHPLIATVVLRTAQKWTKPTKQLLDDLVQETYLKLCADDCKLLRNFRSQHEGAIFGFLKIVTANVVHDHFKASLAIKRGSGEVIDSLDHEGSTSQVSAPARSDDTLIEQQVLLHQIDSCLARLVEPDDLARSRRIFWLYYRWGLSASAIASLPGVDLTTKGVESALLRLTRLVRAELAGPGPGQGAAAFQKGLSPSGSF